VLSGSSERMRSHAENPAEAGPFCKHRGASEEYGEGNDERSDCLPQSVRSSLGLGDHWMDGSEVNDDEERKAIEMITVLVGSREDASAARLAEDMAKKVILPVLRAMPEGERELFDHEQDPPVGVALRDRPGTRIVEWAAVPDEAILWAAKLGMLKGFDSAVWDGLAQANSLDVQQMIGLIRPHIHQGSVETIVSLPERGKR